MHKYISLQTLWIFGSNEYFIFLRLGIYHLMMRRFYQIPHFKARLKEKS
jgi:hypothetical protein